VPTVVENSDLVADHALLERLANRTGGQMLQPGELGKLVEILKNEENMQSVSYDDKKIKKDWKKELGL